MWNPQKAMNDFVTAIQRGKTGPVREMLDRSPELVSMYHAGSYGGTGGAVVSEGHRKDAELGAKGELRNRNRPLEAWVEIRDSLLESN